MLIGGVIRHEIHNDPDLTLLALRNHVIEVVQVSIHRVDVSIIGNVIAKIHLRRRIARSDPNGIDSQFVQVTHFGADALEVADAVVVTIREAARIDFVKHSMLPPLVSFSVGPFLLSDGRLDIDFFLLPET